MKIFVTMLCLAVASAQISQQRQSSLDVLAKLQKALPDFSTSWDSVDQHVSEAKQNASLILNTFILNVFDIKKKSLQSILDFEAETVAFGDKFESWCWESNVPMLEGIMGWIGTDYSDCITQLDKSAQKIIGSIYNEFFKDETAINYNYSLFSAFEKKNIINNPQSIDIAITNTIFDMGNAIPDFSSVISNFERNLNDTLPIYSECLNQKLSGRRQLIKHLKKETLRCVDELKTSALSDIIPRKAIM